MAMFTPVQLVEKRGKSMAGSSIGIGAVGENSTILETFFVLEDLHELAILGETLLATLDAYSKHLDNFASSETRQVSSCIGWGDTKGPGEGSCPARPDQTEHQELRDTMGTPNSKYEAREEEIDEFIALGISEADARDKRRANDEDYIKTFLNPWKDRIVRVWGLQWCQAKLNGLRSKSQ